MFRLVRIGFVLVCLVAVFWLGTQVKLGELTLYEHVRAIAQSKESQDLINGTKTRVSDGVSGVTDSVGEKKGALVDTPKRPDARSRGEEKIKEREVDGKPAHAVPESDRKALKKLLESRK